MIQQGINQLLTMGAVAARLSPEYDKKVEISKTKGNISSLTEQGRVLANEYTGSRRTEQIQTLEAELSGKEAKIPSIQEAFKNRREKIFGDLTGVNTELQAAYKKLFELEPTQANLEQRMGKIGYSVMAQKGRQQVLQRNQFKDFITQLEQEVRDGK